MTGPSALAFPGSRTLAGWWRQLAPHQPKALWFSHLVLHRIEAPVQVRRSYRPDPLDSHLLRTLDYLERAPDRPGGPDVDELNRLLCLGPQVLYRLFDHLRRAGLVQEFCGSYRLCDAGRQALDKGEMVVTRQERRSFFFLEASPPVYLPLRQAQTTPWVAGPDWCFDLEQFVRCMNRDPEWKQRHGFPLDVDGIARVVGEGDGQAAAWRHVVLDCPERLPIALALVASEGEATRLLGFAVRPDNWSLQGNDPTLEFDAWRDVFPQLAKEPPDHQWAEAWRKWCEPRSLPEAQTVACTFERQENLLRVHAPPRLIDRLRGLRSDVIRGEAWILAGEGLLRRAVLLEVVATKQEKSAGPL
jgi:hypothetical protein